MSSGYFAPENPRGQRFEDDVPLTPLTSPGYRKSLPSPLINEVFGSTHSKSHSRNWSGSTRITASGDDFDDTDQLVAEKTKSNIISNGSWFLEILCLVVGILSFGASIALLVVFHDKPLPQWPFGITLNTLIALVSAITNASLAVPLASGFGQLKWNWFKRKPSPLTDMELFDEASRGSWGAVRLLSSCRGGYIGMFGAFITIAALFLGPFSHVPAALNYTPALPGNSGSTGFVPILPMKSAVFHGLFSESGLAQPKPICPTGNCTYPPLTTLATCSTCVDIRSVMMQYCAEDDTDASKCGLQAMGAKLQSSNDAFSMTTFIPSKSGNMPHSNIMKFIFMGTESRNGTAGDLQPWATQCTLEYCAQSINSTMVNGELIEVVTSETRNTTVIDTTNSMGKAKIAIMTPDNTSVFISEPAALGIQSWFTTLFANGSASRNSDFQSLDADALVVVNLTVGISSGTTYFDTDIVQTFYWDYYEYNDGIPQAMNELATAMTVAFRSFKTVPIYGKATSTQIYVHVQGVWIVLPLFVVGATAIFLVLAMINTSRSGAELWKGSALAMLFYGLDHATKVQFGTEGAFDEKKRRMRSLMVYLDEDKNFGNVLRS
ncbi:hypothetical protein IFR04_000204 [Cadophora malorum]|uniref:Uncharacterized protein n=1 Tax=Cadophora malorum TaxID=108018 RepID=A0A8H8BX01_9HELO|nr:hypothetical protein IFR04_000204 [Cadophora malorum]